MPPRAALSAAELLHLATELDSAVLRFPEEPDDELQTAARVLQAACQRVAAACISACHLLRLPDEVLMRILRELKANQLAALAMTCHAVNGGAPSLINRGAQCAVDHQYSAELAVLPPKGLRTQGQLRWLEAAAKEAQSWLVTVGTEDRTSDKVIWPKARRSDESRWLEAIARLGAGGRDLTIHLEDHDHHLDEAGEHAQAGVRGALLFLKTMANRAAVLEEEEAMDYEKQQGPYAPPSISASAVRWVAEQVPTLGVDKELPMAEFIMHKMMRAFKPSWKTRDLVGRALTEGHDSVVKAYLVVRNYEPLLRAIVDARTAAHGSDHELTLRARVDLGEVLAAAASVQASPIPSLVPGGPNQDTITILKWGEVPHGEADTVLADALSTMRSAGVVLTSQLGVRTVSARAAWLAQRGLFAQAATLLRGLLEMFVERDGGRYTHQSWGRDNGLAEQIRALARHTRKQSPGSEALAEGCRLLRAHVTALGNTPVSPHTGEYDLRTLYYEKDAMLLLSHLRRAEGGAMLSEAEELARQLIATRRHEWDFTPQIKLFKVLAAKLAVEVRSATDAALRECRQALCSALVAQLNNQLHPYGADQLFGSLDLDCRHNIGYYRDGSGGDPEEASLRRIFRMKGTALRAHGIIQEVEARQRALLEERRAGASHGHAAAREAYKAQGRLVKLLLVQGKYDPAMDELSALCVSICDTLGMTDRFAEDAYRELRVWHRMYRSADVTETICTDAQWEATLRNRVAACQRSGQPLTEAAALEATLEELRLLPAAMLEHLTTSASELAEHLCKTGRGHEIESELRLLRRAALAWDHAIVAHEEGDDESRRHHIHSARTKQMAMLDVLARHLLSSSRQDAQAGGPWTDGQWAEYEAFLVDRLALLDKLLDATSPPSAMRNFLLLGAKDRTTHLLGRHDVTSLSLVYARAALGRRDEARQSAHQLIDDSRDSPLVRGRAMVWLAQSLVREAGLPDASSPGGDGAQAEDPSTVAALLQAEPLLSRACVLLNAMLDDEIAFVNWGAEPLEWHELDTCLQLHEGVLFGLGRQEAAMERRRAAAAAWLATVSQGKRC